MYPFQQKLHLCKGAMRASDTHALQVRKAVYASTTKSQLNLTNRKMEETNPTMTFPDMSFAVDNFEEAFDSLVSLNTLAVDQLHHNHSSRFAALVG